MLIDISFCAFRAVYQKMSDQVATTTTETSLVTVQKAQHRNRFALEIRCHCRSIRRSWCALSLGLELSGALVVLLRVADRVENCHVRPESIDFFSRWISTSGRTNKA